MEYYIKIPIGSQKGLGSSVTMRSTFEKNGIVFKHPFPRQTKEKKNKMKTFLSKASLSWREKSTNV